MTVRKQQNIDDGVPKNLMAESTIIGAVFIDPDSLLTCGDLKAEDFYLSAHRTIFRVQQKMYERDGAIDIINVTDELVKMKCLEDVGGVAYLSATLDGVPHTPDLKVYAQMLIERKRKREVLDIAERMTKVVLDDSDESADSIISAFDTELLKVVSRNRLNEAVLVKEFTRDVFSTIMTQRAQKRDIVGLTTSIRALDYSLGGLRNGENIVIAGRTGGGKTAFMLQVCAHVASNDNPVHVFSLEMSKEELLMRLAAGVAKLNHLKLKFPTEMQDEDLEKLAAAMAEIERWPLWIDDSATLDINQMQARARIAKKKGAKLFAVDYLQKVQAPEAENVRDRVNIVSDGIRQIAKTNKVPVLNLSQLTRVEKGSKREPQLDDLKESGNIEQDAHTVLLLHIQLGDKGVDDFTGKDKIIIAKQRSGPVGHIRAHFKGSVMRWYERFESDHEEQLPLQEEKGQKGIDFSKIPPQKDGKADATGDK